MKILWLCNVPVSIIANKEKMKNVYGGWLDGAISSLMEDENKQMMYLFPSNNKVQGKIKNLDYCSFTPCDLFKVNNNLIDYFKKIIIDYNPDIIHVWGTEFSHALCMMKACDTVGVLHKTVINIQGLCSVIAKHYNADLPAKIMKKYSLKGLLKGFKNLESEKNDFEKRGRLEIECLKLAKNVIGRTDWDKACTTQINPAVNYYHCNETLRSEFYEGDWSYEHCEKYTIFVSQCNYPIKGFHKLLEAMPLVLQKYPEAKIYTTGRDLINLSLKEKIKLGSYERHIINLIKNFKLENSIKFLGLLSAEQMKKVYINANCFVSCSAIENSPNSVGEAMILGTPTISSDVGGVKNMLIHGEEGYIYPFNEEYMLAYYICKIFEMADEFNMNDMAKIHARNTHNIKINQETLLVIYDKIINYVDACDINA